MKNGYCRIYHFAHSATMPANLIARLCLFIQLFVALSWASAANAAGFADIPEPSNLALMALGIAGMVIGRRAARSRVRREDHSARP